LGGIKINKMNLYRINSETGLREEVHSPATGNLTMPVEKPARPLTRYLYTFKDSPKISGERITFEDSPIVLFLHPNNQYWVKRKDTLWMQSLERARQFFNEKQWNFLKRKVYDIQTYVQETARKSSPLLPHLHSGRINTFDIGVFMNREGNYIQLDGKKGTPYEMLGSNHISLQR